MLLLFCSTAKRKKEKKSKKKNLEKKEKKTLSPSPSSAIAFDASSTDRNSRNAYARSGYTLHAVSGAPGAAAAPDSASSELKCARSSASVAPIGRPPT